ncbi:MAG TPA: glycosyltransferase [Clostridia bacterium]|nr:glycosyltransferase [Clostridia bacterium]
MKKYSFVIPAYNNKILLKNTLEALNYQKGFGREDYEAVVVDDGSESPLYEYIRDVNKNYTLKYIYLQRDELSCRSRTRNFGCKLAEGEYIIFIDSDILVREDYLLELERCYSVRKDMAVIGTRLNLNNEISYNSVADGSVFNKYRFDTVGFDQYEIRHFMFDEMSYNLYSETPPWIKFYSCNAVVPKWCFDKTGGFDEEYKGWGMEDNDLGYRLYKEGLKMIASSKMEALHQFHGTSDPFAVPVDRSNEHRRNIDYFIDKFPEAFIFPRAAVYDLFEGRGKDILRPDKPPAEKISIKFSEISKLNDIKSAILELCEKDNLEIVVEDYVEATDLDIWIQLLESPRSIPKYYPMSKRFKKDQVNIEASRD